MTVTGISRLVLLLGLITTQFCVAAQDSHSANHHPHHIALVAGISWYGSKNSAYLGADYVYYWENGWGVGGFYEEVNGDFDVKATGLLISRDFQNGWKINFGPGMEHKLKENKNLALFRLQAGYDWHSGHWRWGPQLTVDLIEDGHTTYYAGFSVGRGW